MNNDYKFKPGNKYAVKKGEVRNPKGRPPIKTLSEAYRHVLEQKAHNDKKGRTNAEVIADKLAGLAKRGNVNAAREITDRAEGKPRQSITVEGNAPMVILKNADNKADEKTEPSLG